MRVSCDRSAESPAGWQAVLGLRALVDISDPIASFDPEQRLPIAQG